MLKRQGHSRLAAGYYGSRIEVMIGYTPADSSPVGCATNTLVFVLPDKVLVVLRWLYSRFKLVVPVGTTCYKSSTKKDLFEPLLVGRDTQRSRIPDSSSRESL
jgi:hypothetical protein